MRMERPLMLRERSPPTLVANQTRWVSLAQLAALSGMLRACDHAWPGLCSRG